MYSPASNNVLEANCICIACNVPTTQCNFTLHFPTPTGNFYLPTGRDRFCQEELRVIIDRGYGHVQEGVMRDNCGDKNSNRCGKFLDRLCL